MKSEVLWILWISFPVPVDLTGKGTGPVQGNTTLGRPVLRSNDNAESALRQAFKVCRKSLDRTTMEYDSYIYRYHRYHVSYNFCLDVVRIDIYHIEGLCRIISFIQYESY